MEKCLESADFPVRPQFQTDAYPSNHLDPAIGRFPNSTYSRSTQMPQLSGYPSRSRMYQRRKRIAQASKANATIIEPEARTFINNVFSNLFIPTLHRFRLYASSRDRRRDASRRGCMGRSGWPLCTDSIFLDSSGNNLLMVEPSSFDDQLSTRSDANRQLIPCSGKLREVSLRSLRAKPSHQDHAKGKVHNLLRAHRSPSMYFTTS